MHCRTTLSEDCASAASRPPTFAQLRVVYQRKILRNRNHVSQGHEVTLRDSNSSPLTKRWPQKGASIALVYVLVKTMREGLAGVTCSLIFQLGYATFLELTRRLELLTCCLQGRRREFPSASKLFSHWGNLLRWPAIRHERRLLPRDSQGSDPAGTSLEEAHAPRRSLHAGGGIPDSRPTVPR